MLGKLGFFVAVAVAVVVAVCVVLGCGGERRCAKPAGACAQREGERRLQRGRHRPQAMNVMVEVEGAGQTCLCMPPGRLTALQRSC